MASIPDKRLRPVTKDTPCPHCNKPDWCYFVGELSVCNRQQPPGQGWEATSKADKDGKLFYAPMHEKKPIREANTREWEYKARDGSRLVKVRRIDYGDDRKKKFTQYQWNKAKGKWVAGLDGVERSNIPIYGYSDIQQAIAANKPIFLVDGESCADALRSLGLAATTSIMGMGKWQPSDTRDLEGAAVVICPDRDLTGIEQATKLAAYFPHAQWLYAYPDAPAWNNLPASAGLDVEDWIKSENLGAEDLLISIFSRPRTRENVVRLSSISSASDYIPDTAPVAGQNFILKAEDALYSEGHYVSIGGVLYRFTGSYYEELNESKEKRRIGGWLKTYSEKVKGVWVNNRADTASVNAVFNWVVNQTAVDSAEVNPGGLNCSNGVVKINPDGTHKFTPHTHKKIYTYVACKYDPHIDATDCDRLLECLEPPLKEIFIRTVAAALDLNLVRSKLTGKGVRALLCYGEGSNGKDTLRAVMAAVFGQGMTSKSLADFKAYDAGRKFSLAGLEGSLLNWASENAPNLSLDNIQSLKQCVTGDPIDIERKGKDSYEYKPSSIQIFNCNELPGITGGTAAIDDRYGILRFNKTYKRNADASLGELEADARFKDDPTFILEQIAPALLNKMLERFPVLLSDGIDYTATRDAMRTAQEESRHLWMFAREVGLEAQAGGRVWVKDLWQQLQDWYSEAGILEFEYDARGKEKLVWNELPNRYDAPVKAINQLHSRLSEIFPKVQIHRYNGRDEIERRGQKYLLGIGFVQTGLPELPVDTARLTGLPTELPRNTGNPVGNPIGNPVSHTQRSGNSGNPVLPPFEQIRNLLGRISEKERQELAAMLTRSPENSLPLPATVAPEDELKIREIALTWWDEYYPEQMQALLTQMYGWQAPGTKYDAATLVEWLEGEPALVRDRITELIHRRGEDDNSIP